MYANTTTTTTTTTTTNNNNDTNNDNNNNTNDNHRDNNASWVFCWSHGWNPSHNGTGCIRKVIGRNPYATTHSSTGGNPWDVEKTQWLPG